MLHPFTYEELVEMERLNIVHHKVGNLKFDSKTLDDIVLGAISKKIVKMQSVDIENHGWFTYWGIILPDTNVCIGLVGFKGYPDANGYTEVGYGLSPNYRRQGYMKEALSGLTDWAFGFDYCKGITACGVLTSNIGSQLVLTRNSFKETSRGNEVINYLLLK